MGMNQKRIAFLLPPLFLMAGAAEFSNFFWVIAFGVVEAVAIIATYLSWRAGTLAEHLRLRRKVTSIR
jgi:hypothetical protein